MIKKMEIRTLPGLVQQILVIFLLCSWWMPANANDTMEPVYVGPVLDESSDIGSSFYPGGEARMARTARADTSFMIGKDGSTFAPMIEQINNHRVRGAVLKRIESLKFAPATLNGKPVDSWATRRFRFNMGYDQRSAYVSTKQFSKHLTSFSEEMGKESPDPKQLQKYLKKLNGTRHGHHIAYEYVSAARYNYAARFGDRDAQIYAIREMLLSNDRGTAKIGNDVAHKELIRLLIEAGYYGEAQLAYNEALRKYRGATDENLRQVFGPTIEQIKDILESDKAFGRQVMIGEEGYAFLPLAKSGFAFEETSGAMEKLVLRCNHKFAELPFKSDTDYKIPEKWGACQLQIIGDEGASAQLIQF